ncbi:hypothetical protein NE235_14920 [Actinoallomurus spadix]|uniref:MarR family transcriptional regulator n=1 Tax=Actinoallomurus spadix TaxID=79912 RepID=A0ABN0WFI0_9ACTN|nr:hypothetical protein [Actinoallomurus spadix]MCO5987396.1 hypothetical protein [Actinoallomurus spadix]
MSQQEEMNYHIARLLVILRHFGPTEKRPLKGITKLAKLDFLLRYPAFTDQIIANRGLQWPLGAEPSESEFKAVESRMIRYKYGPWDDRYYPLIGRLVGLGLAEVSKEKRALSIRLTDEGRARAESISRTREWLEVELRARFLRENLNLTGNRLKEIIYAELPDVVDRPHRVEI